MYRKHLNKVRQKKEKKNSLLLFKLTILIIFLAFFRYNLIKWDNKKY